MSTIGERIAEIRKQQGFTQASLARLAGVSTSSIAMYETNRRQPDATTLQSLTEALGVTLEVDDLGRLANFVTPASESTGEKTPPSKDSSESLTQTPNADSFTKSAAPSEKESGWTNLTLSRDEARFILFMRMHPDSKLFLQSYMNADEQKRKQIEKAMRLIEAFQN